MYLVVNKVPQTLDFNDVRARVEQTYNCEVPVVLPHSDEMMILASSGIFTIHHPDHPISQSYRRLTDLLLK